MNIALQIRIADVFYQAGMRQSQGEPEKARDNFSIAKETVQLCLKASPPDLKPETRAQLERGILKIREKLVGLELE